MLTRPTSRALSVLTLCLLTAGCAAVRRPTFDAQSQWTFDYSVQAVNQAVPEVMETLGMLIVEQEFDGAIGYVQARTPAGAIIQLSYETMTPERTYVRVHATRRYGDELSGMVMNHLYEAAYEAATMQAAEAEEADANAHEAAHHAHEAYVTAINSNDLDTLLGMLTDDVVFMYPNEPAMVGKAAVRPWLEGYLEAYTTHWDKPVQEFVVNGDWAYERYSYASTDTPRAGGDVLEDTGWGLVVYRRDDDGVWRVARDAWASDRATPEG